MTRRLVLLTVASAVLVAAPSGGSGGRQSVRECTPTPSAAYATRVDRALRATTDVWGNAILSPPGGASYARARAFLAPLLLGRAANGAKLTASGYHYLPFSGPVGLTGAGSQALHVADGSQILAQRASGRSLMIGVGAGGRERYGSCLAKLGTPRLAGGSLPILRTSYVDAGGTRYRQESFATRSAPGRPLVSFVAVTAESDRVSATIRLTVSDRALVRRGSSLVRRDGEAVLSFSKGATVEESSVSYDVPAAGSRTVYVAWPNQPATGPQPEVDREAYERARAKLARHWREWLRSGPAIDVPEPRVMNSYRAVLIQSLGMTWRYSVGNAYQQFSYPEGVDVAQVLSALGYRDVSRSILLTSFGTPLSRYPNWKMGQKLVGCALYYRLHRDRAFVERATPHLRTYVGALGRQIEASPRGMLERERFSSDVADRVYGLHTHAVVWQGLRSMAAVWAATGRRSLAREARTLAVRLERGLRAAIRVSQRRLSDGSLFIPARLLDRERPYRSVTESRAGSYWNLVSPYAFASGLFPPGSPQANGAIRYLLLHGSRLLGLVRAGAYSLYGLNSAFPTSGVNPVYGLNAARLFADNDRPEQLVLSLYGQLAAAMAPGTFVAGEGVSVTPLEREYYRSTYLPPNSASNASFLETLRLMLVRETRSPKLEPRGLELASATPRAWLEPGKTIVVRRIPTSFGPISYSIAARASRLRVTVDVPERERPRSLRLHVRLAQGRIVGVTLGGRPYAMFDPHRETIDLSGRTGRLNLVVNVT